MTSPSVPRMTVSFVLFNTPAEEVARAVLQVRRSPVAAEIILVDNSPVPLPPVEGDPSAVRQVHSGGNLGYGGGHNIAIRMADQRTNYHLALNTDVAYGPEALPALIAFMDAHCDVGLSMPRVVYPDGRIQHLCRLLPHPLDVFGRGFAGASRWTQQRNVRYENRDWSYDRQADFPFLSGCFMVMRRSVLVEVGGFDERFFMYGEDADLSRRIHGVARTSFAPVATAVHDYRSQAGGWRRTAYKVANLSRYFNKWGWLRDPERERINAATRAALTAPRSPRTS